MLLHTLPSPTTLHREVTRHGKVVWYARAGGSSRGRASSCVPTSAPRNSGPSIRRH